ncbi:MAG: cytochrome c oxidase assembly protein [Acidobacteriota bacterium]
MTTVELLESTWNPAPSILAGCALLFILHLVVSKGRPLHSVTLFLLGDLTLLFALISPLDELGDTYLFSAHMIQHLLLVLLVPPLLIAGLPRTPLRSLLRRRNFRRLESVLSKPLVAWILGIGTLWIWHLPVLYDLTLANEQIHIFEHLTFLVTGTIFWWPIFTPLKDYRYDTAIRDGWGLDAADDQQLGGVLMWVLGGLSFLTALMIVLRRWLQGPSVQPAGVADMRVAGTTGRLNRKGGSESA